MRPYNFTRVIVSKKSKDVAHWFDWLMYINEHPNCTRHECKCATAPCVVFKSQWATNEWASLASSVYVVRGVRNGVQHFKISQKGYDFLVEQVKIVNETFGTNIEV